MKDLVADLPYKSLAELLDYQAENRSNKICLLYPDLASEPLRYASVTYAQVNAAADRLAKKYAQQIDISSNTEKPVTVGLLASSSIDYLLTFYGLIKLGVVIFLLSTRNSKAALKHLIEKTGVSYLVIGSGQIHVELDGLKIIPFEAVNWDEHDDNISCSFNNKGNDSLEQVRLILHSSGSTSFPKPIYYTNRSILNAPVTIMDINKNFFDETDIVLNWGVLFHAMTFMISTTCLATGAVFAFPLARNYPLTPKELLANIQVEQINKLVSVPSLLEQVVLELESNSSMSFSLLSRLKFIVYGGAIMSDKLGQKLINNDVHLVSCYGSTETSIVMMTDLNAPITRWKWVKIGEHRKPFVKIRSEDNVLVLLPNDPFCQPSIANQSDGSYVTNDICIEDPPGSGEYRIEGRQDDLLVHQNGEKTNPLPMEHMMCQFPIVYRVFVFGHQRLCTGVLIQLNREVADNYSIDEILDKVWEAVQAGNLLAPTHSRIVRQMVKCLPMNKVLPVTDKGNVIRKRANMEYATVIDDLYKKFLEADEANGLSIETKREWTKDSLGDHIEKLISALNVKKIEEFHDRSKSIFDIGFDSLHVVQLRNELSTIFPSIPMNFVYQYPSIDLMVNELLTKNNKASMQIQQNDPHHYILTEELIDKYINQMKNNTFSSDNIKQRDGKRIFLVTGANGSLGSWIILHLLKQTSTDKIFCLFRGSDKTRIIKEFEQRYQSTDIFNENPGRLVLLHNMYLSDEFLGQHIEIYNQLCDEVTDIIHSAYRMDFNLTVRDFEKDGIIGVYHLLKLTRKAQARFHFVSSIAAAGSGFVSIIKEEPLIRQSQLPIAQGYGQSKYVCEHLCYAAKQLWNIPVDIYRLGQISGDSIHGAWNTSEMISLMICTGGGELGIMPSQGQDVRWIPVDIAASSIVEIVFQDYTENDTVHHIINPHEIPWSTFLDYLKKAGLHFRIVNPNEWLEKVFNSQTALITLSAFFDRFFTAKTGFQIAEYETIKTEFRSKSVHTCPIINIELIRKYLTFWSNIGFLTHGYQ